MHVRLALLVRNTSDIKSVTFVTRRQARSRAAAIDQDCAIAPSTLPTDSFLDNDPEFQALVQDFPGLSARQAGKQSVWRVVASGSDEEGQALASADVIFCTTPSRTPLWDASKHPLHGKPLICAIGSYTANMIEVPVEVVRSVVDGVVQGNGPPRVFVDYQQACLSESGELVRAGLGHEDVIDMGVLASGVAQRPGRDSRDSDSTINDQTMATHCPKAWADDLQNAWVRSETVLYKSVGCGVMDTAVAEFLLRKLETPAGQTTPGISVVEF